MLLTDSINILIFDAKLRKIRYKLEQDGLKGKIVEIIVVIKKI